MATIKLRKSDNVGVPANGTLAKGEVAYSYTANAGGSKLYIGTGDAETSPAVAIGGQYYTGLLDHTAGTLTDDSAIIVDGDSRINQLIIGDSTSDITITGSTLTLPAGGLTVSGGTITLGSQTITGLAAPTNNTDAATKQYVDGVATGLNVQDDQGTPNTGTIPGSGTFTFLGTQGVTTLFDDGTDSLTIGLQQSLDETSNVAFGSATVGSAENKIKIEDDQINQVDPQIYLQFNSTPGQAVAYADNQFNINSHGLENGEAVVYESPNALTELTSGTTYYVIQISDNAFKLSATAAPSLSPISIGGTGGSASDVIRTASNPVNLFSTSDSITIGSSTNSTVDIQDDLTVGGNTTITGNLTVNGTSTTVNSTIVQVDDPILEVGTSTVDYDGLGRGVKFKYKEGSEQVGFFGYDVKNSANDAADGAGKFRFLTNASNVDANNISGTKGTIVADLEGAVTGNATTTTGFDSSVLTQNDIDGQGGTAAVAGRQITLAGDIVSQIDDPSNPGTLIDSAVTWDGTGNLTINTRLGSTVASLLGTYVESVGLPETTPGTPDPSALIVGSLNAQTSGNRVSVDVRTATTRANATSITKADLGVASFSATAFSVTDGWVDLNVVDGGSYGS